jgi:hypothetical protein
MRLNSICPSPLLSTMGNFLVKKSPLYEGKYSLGNGSTIPIDYDIEMKYLCQVIVTKISGFRIFHIKKAIEVLVEWLGVS